MHRPAPLPSRTAQRRREFARTAAALLWLGWTALAAQTAKPPQTEPGQAAAAPAQAGGQAAKAEPASGPTSTDVKLVAAEAERLLTADDPLLRGEAALLLATTGELRHHDAILAVAKETQFDARSRGLVALGLLAAPGSESAIEAALGDNLARSPKDELAAVFALGLLPASSSASAHRQLARFQASNYKRQRDAMLAMLVALQCADDQTPAGGTPTSTPLHKKLTELVEDSSNRDPVVRGQLLMVLARTLTGPLPKEQRLLESGALEERLAVLRAMQRRPADPALLPLAVRLQEKDSSPEVRAAALALLTTWRHLPALELAAHAIKSDKPVEVAQAVTSALRLGGSGMRGAIEAQIQNCAVPAAAAAMMRAFDTEASEPFAQTCLSLAADRKKALELRLAAARIAAHTLGDRAAPVLRDLFLEGKDARALVDLARLLLSLQPEAPELQRLFDSDRPEHVSTLPDRLRALLAAGYPQAVRYLLQRLAATPPSLQEKALLLRSFRLALRPLVPPEQLALLAEPLAAMFR